MLPIIELRGAIPVGVAMELSMWINYLVCIVGNLIPVPFILILIRKILHYMHTCKVPLFRKVSDFIIRKAEKNKDKITKYATLGLFIFVALPLPGTGAWTGALVAAMLEMKFKNALISIILGVLTAGVVVTAISYGFLGFLSWLV
ncbi:MAG: small multi-drug export protein [Clostridia bacterium]|nr:small multi-drug export protein [Clostridia bacterium]